MADLQAGFPHDSEPFLNPDGTVARAWKYLLQTFYARTGGVQGNSGVSVISSGNGAAVFLDSNDDATENPPAVALRPVAGNPVTVAVGASPFTFVAPYDGTAVISDGGLSDLQFSRDGVNFFGTGSFRGLFPLAGGDQLRMTYITGAAPTVTFVAK